MARQIRFYGKLDLNTPPVCYEPEPTPTPTPSPSQEPEFILLCGFQALLENGDPSGVDYLINGVHTYGGLDDNNYPLWSNGYYTLKFDILNNNYIIAANLYVEPFYATVYYLFGTTSPLGTTWRNHFTNESVIGASSTSTQSQFDECL
jgi:hypothetical protein